jgi:ABC-2 type transport system permease protein
VNKILAVASREFIATVGTRGFIIGWLLTPVLMTLMIFAIPRLYSQRTFRAQGEIAVLDHTDSVTASLREVVDPGQVARRRAIAARRALENAARVTGSMGTPAGGAQAIDAAANMIGQPPDLHITELPRDTDATREKMWLLSPEDGRPHLAVAVIEPRAVTMSDPASAASAYELYVPANLDARTEGVVRQMLNDAIVAVRIKRYGLDLPRLDELTHVDGGRSVTVTRSGAEQASAGVFNRFLPFAFIVFMLIGVLGGGQFLLTTMVEEKSSRIIEVLLSAVSPVELLAGKIVGQLAASMVGMGLYVLVAVLALLAFALFGLIDPVLLLFLLLFFLFSFLIVGSVMVAVGAAVNEMRDAQSLLMPFMLLLAVVWVVAMPISMNPNSPLATTLSFTPVLSPFAMMIRLASATPPPHWQLLLSLLVDVVSAIAAVWFAAKVFRIALLLHGRPPNLATLLRWALSP